MNKPDYQIAQEQAEELFKSLGINWKISEPKAKVSDDKEKPWPQIAYLVTFEKGNRDIDFDYSLGIGHVKYTYLPTNMKLKGYLWEQLFRAMKEGAQIKKGYEKEQAEIAVSLAKVQKVQPKAYEVLAMYCREGLEAIETTFEDWASNFGYDVDSRKAEKIYNLCRDNYTKLLKILTKAQIEQFAELANQF